MGGDFQTRAPVSAPVSRAGGEGRVARGRAQEKSAGDPAGGTSESRRTTKLPARRS